MSVPRDAYKYYFKVGDKVVFHGVTNDLQRSEKEHKVRWPDGHIEQVGSRTTWRQAQKWAVETDGYGEELFHLGTQYYIAGRFSLLSQLSPVCGNLLHHAIELFLKGYHSKCVGIDDVRSYGHDVENLWKEFKKSVSDSSLDRYDDVIMRLHKFERIRYPDWYLSKGMIAVIGLRKGDFSHTFNNVVRTDSRFGFDLEEVDELVSTIIGKSSVNLSYFTSTFANEAKTYLIKENLHI